MHPTGLQTVDEVRADMLSLRLFVAWTFAGAVLMIIALLMARFVLGGWWVASWTLGTLSIMAAGKGAFEFGRNAPRPLKTLKT